MGLAAQGTTNADPSTPVILLVHNPEHGGVPIKRTRDLYAYACPRNLLFLQQFSAAYDSFTV